MAHPQGGVGGRVRGHGGPSRQRERRRGITRRKSHCKRKKGRVRGLGGLSGQKERRREMTRRRSHCTRKKTM